MFNIRNTTYISYSTVKQLACELHGGAVVSTVASQQEDPGFGSWVDLPVSFCVTFASVVPVWVSSGYSGFLPV